MNQENKQTETTIEEVVKEFCAMEADYQSARTVREKLRTRIIEHAKAQPDAFVGEEKSYHIEGGVVVRRAVKTVSHFDEDKMNSTWLRNILATPSAAAIKVSIDPKRLYHDSATDELLSAIDYAEEQRSAYSVETTTVSNQ